MSILVAEAPGYLQVFSDGSVNRFAPEIATASPEMSIDGYKSKDVVIDPSKLVTARLFLPETKKPLDMLMPIVVYFHGGGFCVGSTTWLGYHHFLGDFSVKSKSIVFSIDYRLAPENRLPVAYDDCYSSLQWLSRHVNAEPWLKQGDLSRVFLSGDSAGGNIAHQVAIKVMRNKVPRVDIKGLMLIHPYFGSEKRTEGSNRDYFGCNLAMQEVSVREWRSEFPAVAVFVAELDFLKERGLMHAEFLQKKGVRHVKLMESEGESHVFHVFNPKSESTCLLQEQMSEFMRSS